MIVSAFQVLSADSKLLLSRGVKRRGVADLREVLNITVAALQVKRLKQVLSANSESSLSVEELHNGIDFRSHITRQAFEVTIGRDWLLCMLADRIMANLIFQTISSISIFQSIEPSCIRLVKWLSFPAQQSSVTVRTASCLWIVTVASAQKEDVS